MPLRTISERIRVCCLPRAVHVAEEWRATHVVSLLDPELDDRHVPVIIGAEHIVARLRDQENQQATGHFPNVVESLFETIRPALDANSSRILVHCHAGVSRSTAFAYAMTAYLAGEGREDEAFESFMSIVSKPWPNRRIIEILDRHWERDGALLLPLDRMRQRHPRRIEAWQRFNEKRRFFDLVPSSRYHR